MKVVERLRPERLTDYAERYFDTELQPVKDAMRAELGIHPEEIEYQFREKRGIFVWGFLHGRNWHGGRRMLILAIVGGANVGSALLNLGTTYHWWPR